MEKFAVQKNPTTILKRATWRLVKTTVFV